MNAVSAEKYSYVAQAFHWIVGLAILSMIPFGWYMGDVPVSPEKFQLYALHKSIGVTILAAVILRFFWRLYDGVPAAMQSHKPWEKKLSKTVHYVLYFLMLLMPLSGWLMSSAKGFPVSVYGLFNMPDLIAKSQMFGDVLETIHSKAAWAIIILVGLHVAGALKHQFIDKDGTIRRMLPFSLFVFGLFMSLSAMLSSKVAYADETSVKHWEIIPAHSSIVFIAKWDTSDVRGEFTRFNGDIAFDENNLEASHADISIDMTSFDTGYAERDEEIASDSWFALENFPRATFKTRHFAPYSNGYVAQGELELKGHKKEIELPFKLDYKDDGTLRMYGDTTLQRLDFEIGQQGWKSTDIIANDVQVKIELAVKPADQVE